MRDLPALRLPGVKTRLAALAAIVCFGVTAGVAAAALVTVRSTQNSNLGSILVSAKGLTLYHDSAEKKNAIKCTGACAKEWLPLLVTGGAKAIAEPGVTPSLLGTVSRPDGTVQVTYHGMALYTFAGDKKAGDINGQGVGGIWHAIAPSGAIVTKAANTVAGGKTSGSATTTTSSGSGTSGSGTSGSGTSGSGSTSSGSGSSGSGSSGSGSSSSGGSTDCDTNPGGYGCM